MIQARGLPAKDHCLRSPVAGACLALALFLTACAGPRLQKAARPPRPLLRDSPARLALARAIAEDFGGPLPSSSLRATAKQLCSRLAGRPVEVWLLDDPRAIALNLPARILVSRGLLELLSRRADELSRRPYDPGRALLGLFAHLVAHWEWGDASLAPELLALGDDLPASFAEAQVGEENLARVERCLAKLRRIGPSQRDCAEADARALILLRRAGVPETALLTGASALLPEDGLSLGTPTSFVHRHHLSPQRLTVLQAEAPRRPLPAGAASRGDSLAQLLQGRSQRSESDRLLVRAQQLAAKSQRSAALVYARRAVAASPANVGALGLLSKLLAETGHAPEAERYARRAVMLGPSSLRARLALARVYLDQGLTGAAERELAQATSLCPLSATAHQLLARAHAAEPARALRHRAIAKRLAPNRGPPRKESKRRKE